MDKFLDSSTRNSARFIAVAIAGFAVIEWLSLRETSLLEHGFAVAAMLIAAGLLAYLAGPRFFGVARPIAEVLLAIALVISAMTWSSFADASPRMYVCCLFLPPVLACIAAVWSLALTVMAPRLQSLLTVCASGVSLFVFVARIMRLGS